MCARVLLFPLHYKPSVNKYRVNCSVLFANMASALVVTTTQGDITLRLLPDVAPQTVTYISRLVESRLYDGTSFYRSGTACASCSSACLAFATGDAPCSASHLSSTRLSARLCDSDGDARLQQGEPARQPPNQRDGPAQTCFQHPRYRRSGPLVRTLSKHVASWYGNTRASIGLG